MIIDASQKRSLLSKAHALKPVVTVGKNGVTDAVLQELDSSLNAHELLKIKLPAGTTMDILEEIAKRVDATALKQTGRIGILYRKYNANN